MIEVVTQPSHLAGAKVEHVVNREIGPMFVIDRPNRDNREPMHILDGDPSNPTYRTLPGDGRLEVAACDVRTRHMLPAVLDLFRALLGPCPEPVGVERALGLIDAAIVSARVDDCRTKLIKLEPEGMRPHGSWDEVKP